MHIKKCVNKCRIHEKKEKLIETKKLLFKLNRAMNDMMLDYEVGTYVHMLDEYEDLRIMKTITPGYEIGKLNVKMLPMGKKLRKMENNPKIMSYLYMKREYLKLLDTVGEYARSINVDFRKCLSEYDIPKIFIFQGYIDDNKNIASANNIIVPNVNVIYRKEREIIIYPEYDITSNRELRHFYNKTSFKYLEALANDYDFSLEGKNIGKVKIRK